MKRVLVLVLLACTLLVSCISTKMELFSEVDMKGKNIYLAIDNQTTSVSSGSIGVPVGGFMLFTSSSETLTLGSIKNIQLLKQDLQDKGYCITNNPDDADIILVGESHSSMDLSTVRLGFYEKDTGELIMICEGSYGWGWDMQDDLNKALKKALESIPRL